MRVAYPVILSTVVLDAVGFGLVMPILPQLLQQVGHMDNLGWRFGAYLSLYALMQLVFSPVLGSLSDRFGRRPVLMVSAAGACLDYLAMALAPSLWVLLVGRAIAGVTGAGMAVANAYVTDITGESDRARRFAHLSAAFGVGFVLGPALGGLLGAWGLRAPFLAAAALSAGVLALTAVALPETRHAEPTPHPLRLNPFAPLREVMAFESLVPLVIVFATFALVGEIGGTIWVLYGQDKFHWDPVTTGLSLSGFGLFHALVQAFVAGPLVARCGEKRALFVGMASDATAYVLLALATQGWMAFALLPIFCLGGVGPPILQALMSARVDAQAQGRLQGVLTSAMSLATVIGPALISEAYFRTRGVFPGFVWIAGAAVYVLCWPAIAAARLPGRIAPSEAPTEA